MASQNIDNVMIIPKDVISQQAVDAETRSISSRITAYTTFEPILRHLSMPWQDIRGNRRQSDGSIFPDGQPLQTPSRANCPERQELQPSLSLDSSPGTAQAKKG